MIDRADAERDQDDVAPARRERTEAVDADQSSTTASDGEDERARRRAHHAAASEPAPLVIVSPTCVLKLVKRVLSSRGPPRSGRGTWRGAPARPRAPSRRPRPRPARRRQAVGRSPAHQLEVGDVLVPEPGPGLPLGRDRLRLVAAAADQVEERRRELVRAQLAALAQQRRHERGLGVARRRLLVLAVVVGSRARDRRKARRRRAASARRAEREPKHDQPRPPDMRDRVVDFLAPVVELSLRAAAPRRRSAEGGSVATRARAVEVSSGRGKSDPQLDELVRRHRDRPKRRPRRARARRPRGPRPGAPHTR